MFGNLVRDEQHKVEVNYAVDLIKANNLLIGNVLGYIVYQDQFREAVQANNDGTYRYIYGEGNIFQYMNWQTPIIRRDGRVTTGVYAGNVYWHENVSDTFEFLGGNVNSYDLIVSNTNPSAIEEVLGCEVDLPQFEFVCEVQGSDMQNSGIPVYPNGVPITDKYSINAKRVS